MTLNPFTLKELRQLTRSKTIASSLVGFLCACLAVCYAVPAFNAGIDQSTGAVVFAFINAILMIVCAIVIPCNVFARIDKERGGSKRAVDFTLLTALAPAEIIDGKLRGAFALIVLFSTAALPFGVFSYLLHGISFASIFTTLATTATIAVFASHAALALGVLRIGHRLRVFVFVVVLVLGGAMLLPALAFEGVWIVGSSSFSLLKFIAIALTVSCILRGFAIASFSPVVMERDRPLRVAVLFAFIGWGAYVVSLVFLPGFKVYSWIAVASDYLCAFAACAVLLALGASAQEEGYSRRMVAGRPKTRLKRFLAWPFGTGAANGMFFAAALAFVVAVAWPLAKPLVDGYCIGHKVLDAHGMIYKVEFEYAFATVLMYVFSVILLVRFLWYVVTRKVRISPMLVPLAAVALFAFFQSIPAIRAIALAADWPDYFFDMPFCVLKINRHPLMHLCYAGCAFALGAVLNAIVWWRSRARTADAQVGCRK